MYFSWKDWIDWCASQGADTTAFYNLQSTCGVTTNVLSSGTRASGYSNAILRYPGHIAFLRDSSEMSAGTSILSLPTAVANESLKLMPKGFSYTGSTGTANPGSLTYSAYSSQIECFIESPSPFGVKMWFTGATYCNASFPFSYSSGNRVDLYNADGSDGLALTRAHGGLVRTSVTDWTNVTASDIVFGFMMVGTEGEVIHNGAVIGTFSAPNGLTFEYLHPYPSFPTTRVPPAVGAEYTQNSFYLAEYRINDVITTGWYDIAVADYMNCFYAVPGAKAITAERSYLQLATAPGGGDRFDQQPPAVPPDPSCTFWTEKLNVRELCPAT